MSIKTKLAFWKGVEKAADSINEWPKWKRPADFKCTDPIRYPLMRLIAIYRSPHYSQEDVETLIRSYMDVPGFEAIARDVIVVLEKYKNV